MSMRVKYIDVPEGAQEAAQAEGLGQPFSKPSSMIIGGGDVAYATLEPGGWPLNGSRSILPDQPEAFWWSELASNEQCVFMTPPMVVITLPFVITATGVSFVFWPSTAEWCSEIRVTWYNGNTTLHQVVVQPDAANWTLQKTVESFDKICIEVLRTNLPERFAKIQKIDIGQTHWFDEEEISSVHVVNEADPSMSELTVDTMCIKIRDKISRSLTPQKNQKIELYQNEKLCATQYIASSSREEQRDYTFTCQSTIGLLEDEILGGMFNNTPIEEVVQQILEDFVFELDTKYEGQKVTGYLPICTRREALQQLVFSIGAIVTTQCDGIIRIVPLNSGNMGYFTNSNIFNGGKVETDPRVASVEVVAHRYVTSAEDETLLDAETVSGQHVLVTFDSPHHSYSITGGEVTGSGANWVTITAEGKVTLTGKKYLHSTTRHTQRNAAATVFERNNIFAVENATLVHQGNVNNVLKRLYDISQLRQHLKQTVVVTEQRAGQKVVSPNPWGGHLQGYIQSMESNFTAHGHTATVTILGAEVKFDGFKYSGEFYSGDMEAVL